MAGMSDLDQKFKTTMINMLKIKQAAWENKRTGKQRDGNPKVKQRNAGVKIPVTEIMSLMGLLAC